MSEKKIKTLDYLAAKTAHNLIEDAKKQNSPKDMENLITKSLGVLKSQGVYAMYLFLYSQASKNNPYTFTLFYLWNELCDNEVNLPLLYREVRVVQLRHPNSILCEPNKVDLNRISFDKQKDAKEFETFLNNCIKEKDFWALKSGNVPQGLNFSIYQQNNKWKVKADENLFRQFTQLPSSREIILTTIRDLTSDLDTLLLVRDLYEQTLIYARYHAKAAQKS